MNDILQITNDGPLIKATNFWQSEAAARGALYISVNAGAFRLLVPSIHQGIIADMRQGAKHVVISMLAHSKWQDRAACVEFMVEDGTPNPWSCHLSPPQIDRAPGPESVGKEWTASVWDWKQGKPHKCMERPAYFQIVPTLPWLRPVTK